MKLFAKVLIQLSMKLISIKREMRGYIAEYSGRGLPPLMFAVSVELSFFCHRHVICTLDHIFIDFQWHRVPKIWGHVGFNFFMIKPCSSYTPLNIIFINSRFILLLGFYHTISTNMMKHNSFGQNWKDVYCHCFKNWQVTIFFVNCTE